MAWTEERVELLRKYWAEGHSASQIAELLGEGVTRNAVIGKSHRMGLAARPSPLKKAASNAPKRKRPQKTATEASPRTEAAKSEAPKPAATASATEAAAEAPAPQTAGAAKPEPAPAKAPKRVRPRKGRITLLDLNDKICKWPIGHPDKANFHFCGKPVNPDFPYCPEHCLVAYQAQAPRKDRAQAQTQRRTTGGQPRS